MNVAELRSAKAKYGPTMALDGVSLCVEPGEAVALLGPNGAGKSTIIRALTGLKRLSSGKALVFGQSSQSIRARKKIGVTPQETSFPMHMKPLELLKFCQSHFPSPPNLDDLVTAFGLGGNLGKNANALSGGQQRALAVALAFAGGPELVFLDEPTTGLDTKARQRIWNYINNFKAAGGTLFLTTHYIEEAEAIADRIVLINEGRIIGEGSVDDIKARVSARVVRLRAPTAPSLTHAELKTSENNQHTYVSTDADQSIRDLINQGDAFSDLEVLPASLEQAMQQILGDAR